VALAALEVTNALVSNDVRILETSCLLGLVPAVLRYAFPNQPLLLRTQAAMFAHALCHSSAATARMFVACQVKKSCHAWLFAKPLDKVLPTGGLRGASHSGIYFDPHCLHTRKICLDLLCYAWDCPVIFKHCIALCLFRLSCYQPVSYYAFPAGTACIGSADRGQAGREQLPARTGILCNWHTFIAAEAPFP